MTVTAPLPPQVPGLPVLGSGLEMLRDMPAFLVSNYRKLGPIYRARTPADTLTVMMGQEANLFLTSNDGKLLRSREFWEEYTQEFGAPNHVGALNGEPHAWLRGVMKPAFSRRVADDRLPELGEVARRAVRGAATGRPVPVVRFFQRLVSDQLGLLMMGQTSGDYFDDVRLMLRFALNTVLIHKWPRAVLRLPAYQRSKRRLGELARRLVDERRAGRGQYPKPDLISDLIEAHEQRPEVLTDSDVLAEVLIPYIAGLDTVANTCSFALYSLLRYPEVLARVQAEVDALFARPLSVESFRHTPDLHGCLMETMRLYPVTIALQRNATEPFEFAGYRVDAGAPVLTATGGTHFLAEHFPEPERFDIERYREPRNEHRKRGVYTPFGVGPHTCLGAGLAEVLMGVTMAVLLHEARFTLEPNYTLSIGMDPVPTPGPRFKVYMASR
jgi:cytochrome P450